MLTSTDVVKKIDLGGTITGVKDMVNSDISTYPNPFTNELTVKWNGRCEGISVVNVTGQVVYSARISSGLVQTVIPTSKWNAGVYFVKVNQGDSFKILKVIKR